MSEIETDDSSKSKELNQSDNSKQVNIKNEAHEESVNHVCTEVIANTVTETENNNEVIQIKDELKIGETEELEVTNHEVTGTFTTDVNDGVDIKREYTDISENFYDHELVIDNEGVNTIKSEVDKLGKACEVTKELHRRIETLPCKKQRLTSGDIGVNNNTQLCYEQLTNNAPTTENNQNLIHHFPIKIETLFGNKNIFGSTSLDGNIGENLNAIDPEKLSHTVNKRNEGLFITKELEVVEGRLVLKDVMLSFKNKSTQDFLKDLSTKCKDNVTHSPIRKQSLLEDGDNSWEIFSNIVDTSKSGKSVDHGFDVDSFKNLFICDICGKSFQKKPSLRRHIKGHLKLYKCTYCCYKTIDKGSINRHVNHKHTKMTFYNCSYCDYKSYVKSSLNRHVNSKHTKNTVYNCPFCSYKAYIKNCLSEHVNSIHTKNTVHNCPYCSHKTYVKSALSKHVNSQHTKNTVHYCPYCSHKTCVKSSLNTHVNIKHTKNTVYNCPFCSHKTYNKTKFNQHVKIKHSENTKVCS